MKKKLIGTSLLILTAAFTVPLLPGCASAVKRQDTVVSNPDGTFSTNTAYYVNPAITNSIAVARGVTPLIPPPYATLVDSVLALTAAGAGWYARLKTKQAAEHQDAATVATSVLNTVIAGVELANDAKTKATIANVSNAAGNAELLNKVVQDISGRMVPSQTTAAPGS